MLPTLQKIAERDSLTLELVVTGMHLSRQFGSTVDEVRASGLPIAACVPVAIDVDSPAGMARCGAQMMDAIAGRMGRDPPDILLLLGDRVEMLAAGFAGFLGGTTIVHLCGGERSGTVDDGLRHALSRLAHVHLVATEEARDRLVRSGEEDWRVHVVGTPGLVGIDRLASLARQDLPGEYGVSAAPFALFLFHPVVQEAGQAGEQTRAVLDGVVASGLHVIALVPNADHGHSAIRNELESREGLIVVRHMPRHIFLSAMRHAAVMVGNSSSGIIEAASLGTPVVNIGDRQLERARNANVVDCEPSAHSVRAAIDHAISMGRGPFVNLYGDGKTDRRVASLLAELDLRAPDLHKKRMTY
jgi:UDP-hydrolysing UDP-N-acetyl-D-glucosamine 2-epimerase